MHRLLFLVLASWVLTAPASAAEIGRTPGDAMTQAGTPQSVLADLFSREDIGEERFAPAFLAAVSLGEVRALLADLRATVGPVTDVRGEGQAYVVESATHAVPAQIVLDAQGRIAGLFLGAPDAAGRSLAEIVAEMAALAPQSAVLVTRNGETLAAQGADAELAVGSAFKLGVLDTLAQRVAAGEAAWDEVVRLAPGHKSLPTGILQDLPDGAPLTLHSAAALMIAMSDNTATDLLIDRLGREAVAASLGSDLVLTTREFFVLKADAGLRARFLAQEQEEEERQALFDEIAAAPLPEAAAVAAPHDRGVEWYLSARTLCGVLEAVAGLELMGINPGLARPGDWARIAYKGGSETGVLNLSTHLVDEEGDAYCVVATWNADEAIPEAEAFALYTAALSRLSAR